MRGNFIGTDVTGTVALGNGSSGVIIQQGAQHNTIGGTTPGAGNVISGNGEHGVNITGIDATGNQVQGNFIGTDVTGTAALGNGSSGVFIQTRNPNNTIGGTGAGAGNVISGNSTGVFVFEGTENAILSNSIFSNDGLGIDLGTNGVTANDPGDADKGANNRQNYPVITAVGPGGSLVGGTIIEATLNSKGQNIFRIEFFLNTACDPSGNGEGEMFLGFTDVNTEPDGTVSFLVRFDIPVPVGKVVTTTATDGDGNTSEFSECYFLLL